MTFRSMGAIALRPKNEMGLYYFRSLRSGRRINSNQWTVMHVTDEVVQRVHNLANQYGVQDIKDGHILFEWEPSVSIQDHHAYKIPMADSEANNTNIQPLGNVGHDLIIFGNEQYSEDDPVVLATSNEEQAEQGEQRDSNDGDEESIDMNRKYITNVDENNENEEVTDDKGEFIPGDFGQGDITDEN